MTRRLVLFIVLTFAWSWSWWGLNIWLVRSTGASSSLLHFAGAFGPLVAAWLTTAWTDGWSGCRRLFERAYGRLTIRWTLLAMSLPVLFFAIGVLVVSMMPEVSNSSNWFANDKLPDWSPFVLWLIWVATYGFGEESGWRGYLLPTLSERMAVRPATLVVALVWALWHVPVFLYDPDFQDMSVFMIAGWTIGLIFGSFFLGWLTVQADFSIWPAILFHGTFDFLSAGDALPDFIPAISSVLLIGLVLVLARRYDEQFHKR
ncbi:type II CAAX endopeptidase family protein [Exiguobacterium sp. s142]|uniref:CPBP family intramembrane glutamic endopeptidase n=1 Tax=Exiguobacterium sp. s142 TaxID=2751222 RepID=UPI001BE5FF79|nr:type II CAAX endopeptidase family protein [Exiguobacterium sp. s142]